MTLLLLPKLTLLKAVSERLNVPVDALVIAATLAEPFADVVLSGATSAKQLLSNVMGSRILLDDDTRGQLLEIVESPHEYWDKRRSLPWN